MSVKKSKRKEANGKGRVVKHHRIPKRVKVEITKKEEKND